MSDKGIPTPDQVTRVDPEQGMSTMENTLNNFIATADVNAVYGKPIKSGDTLIIPTAEVFCGMGFGFGSGNYEAEKSAEEPEKPAEENETPQVKGYGSGGGGGGYTFSRPVALVIASPDGVRVEPVLDRTKILLAALTTAGFMFGMISGMTKSRR